MRMTKPQHRAHEEVDKNGNGPYNHHYHAFLAADWIEERIGFDTSSHRADLLKFPNRGQTKKILRELKAHLFAATGMHPQHYAAIYHQIAEAEAILGDVSQD